MPYPKPYSYLAYVLAAKQVKYEDLDAILARLAGILEASVAKMAERARAMQSVRYQVDGVEEVAKGRWKAEEEQNRKA